MFLTSSPDDSADQVSQVNMENILSRARLSQGYKSLPSAGASQSTPPAVTYTLNAFPQLVSMHLSLGCLLSISTFTHSKEHLHNLIPACLYPQFISFGWSPKSRNHPKFPLFSYTLHPNPSAWLADSTSEQSPWERSREIQCKHRTHTACHHE